MGLDWGGSRGDCTRLGYETTRNSMHFPTGAQAFRDTQDVHMQSAIHCSGSPGFQASGWRRSSTYFFSQDGWYHLKT